MTVECGKHTIPIVADPRTIDPGDCQRAPGPLFRRTTSVLEVPGRPGMMMVMVTVTASTYRNAKQRLHSFSLVDSPKSNYRCYVVPGTIERCQTLILSINRPNNHYQPPRIIVHPLKQKNLEVKLSLSLYNRTAPFTLICLSIGLKIINPSHYCLHVLIER
jgi:hypothetical protein